MQQNCKGQFFLKQKSI